MANPLKGEKSIKLNGITYNLKLTMGVISEFQELRDKCFMSCAVRAVTAWSQTLQIKNPLERAESLTSAVSLDDAATLVWLAAKESNSQVEFGEIQEAFIDDIEISNDSRFYPAIFADLCLFCVMGQDKKKEMNEASNSG